MQFGGKDLQVFRSAALCCQKGSRFLFCLVLCCDVESSVLRLFLALRRKMWEFPTTPEAALEAWVFIGGRLEVVTSRPDTYAIFVVNV